MLSLPNSAAQRWNARTSPQVRNHLELAELYAWGFDSRAATAAHHVCCALYYAAERRREAYRALDDLERQLIADVRSGIDTVRTEELAWLAS